MTSEELNKLKAMPLFERTRKYTPMMLTGQITKNQYEWIMNLEAPQSAPEAPVSDSTAHPDKVVGKTQKERVLNVLKRGGWFTTLEIASLAYGVDGQVSARVASRINDLKNDGYTIESKKVKRNGKQIGAYRLCRKN